MKNHSKIVANLKNEIVASEPVIDQNDDFTAVFDEIDSLLEKMIETALPKNVRFAKSLRVHVRGAAQRIIDRSIKMEMIATFKQTMIDKYEAE